MTERRIQNPVKHLRWSICENRLRLKTVNYFWKKLHRRCSIMFWIRLSYCKWSLGWQETDTLIRMKNQQKIKELLNDTDLVKVEQWTKMQNACVATKSKPKNTSNYWVWDTVIWMHTLREFKAACEIVQLYLIWTPAQFLEDDIVFQRWI